MWKPIITIARFTYKEAVRSRLIWLLLALVAVGLSLAGFLGSIAITEDRAIQAGALSALWRVAAVFVIGLFVISSIARETADKGMELLFSLPQNRAVYYFGKLAGFAAVGAFGALIIAPVLLLFASPLGVLVWVVSLFCELLLIIALSLFLVFTFTSVTTAVSGLMGCYVLARSIDSFLLMARGPFFDPMSLADRFVAGFFEVLSYLLPALSHYTRADWLLYPFDVCTELLPVLVQTLIYGVLISAAALFDLYRKTL